MFKRHDFKSFWYNPNEPSFNTHKLLGEINFYIAKLCKREAVNLVINEIADDFTKMVTTTKLKELKQYNKNILLTYKK